MYPYVIYNQGTFARTDISWKTVDMILKLGLDKEEFPPKEELVYDLSAGMGPQMI